MDISEFAENTSNGKMTNALVTIILAGFLWVGKTTFEHVGQVAGLRHEIEAAQQDRNLLRAQYDDVLSKLNERTKSRFTREDADKLVLQIKEVEAAQSALKESLLRDYTNLKLELAGIETQSGSLPAIGSSTALRPAAVRLPPVHSGSAIAAQRIHQLEGEIASLEASLVQIRHHVGLSRANYPSSMEPARALVAQPGAHAVPSQRR